MVHCDFGWGGAASGYYVSGVFNTKDENSEKDQPYVKEDDEEDDDHHNYNKHQRIMIYD